MRGIPNRRERLALAGPLGDLGPVDVVQVLHVSGKSGIVRFRSDGLIGAIYVCDGSVVDAELGALRGKEAATEILRWSRGTFDVEFCPVRRGRDAIRESTPGLLIGAMVAHDEAERPSVVEPPKSESSIRGRLPRIGLAVAVIAVAGAALLPRAKDSSASFAKRPTHAHAVATATPRPAPRPAPPASAVPATPGDRTLVVFTTPPHAQILVDGRRAGWTPARVRLPAPARDVEIKILHDGFQGLETVVPAAEGWREDGGTWVRTLRATLRPNRAIEAGVEPPASAVPAPLPSESPQPAG